jgi:glycosyltransferase involved in cell wall biosynthesis
MSDTGPIRVGMFRSPAAFRNFSMDGYAESLSSALRDQCAGMATIEEVRPGPVHDDGARRTPVVRRFADFGSRYPRYLLRARSTRFSINHVVDHAYGHLAYALDPLRTIITCHDIFPLKLWRGGIRGMQPRVTPPVTVLASLSGLRRARAVVTSTQATKDDLVSMMQIDDEKIHVVPYGVDAAFRRFAWGERAEAVARFPLAGSGARYILAVDTGAAYKNRRASIEVLARVRAQSGADVRLVRVGPPLRDADGMLARGCGVSHAIIELGSLTRAELVSVYNLCDVLLFASFYEGFGWPPLEAMACGLPVVTSTAAAITEVVAGAALQSDACDYHALAAHVLRVLGDEAIATRLVERGQAHAATFTWDRAARRVVELYATIIEERTRASGGEREPEVDTRCAA